MPFFKRSLAGPGYTVLNIIRVCNVICLTAVIAASFVMLIKTFVVSKFFFFDGVSHLITAFVSIGLIITEIGIFRRYIANNWPLLSPAHGFVTLGGLMITLGVSILGNLNKEATSQESLGTPMWRCVISAGILTSIFGIINICASYMFRDKSLDITARQVRAHGATAPQKTSPYITPSPRSPRRGLRSMHLHRSKTDAGVLPSYHTRQASNASAHRNISAPVTGTEGLGMGYYGEKPPMMNHEVTATREGGVHCPPVVAGVQRPDLAHHPAFSNVRAPSSVYTSGDQIRESGWVQVPL